MFGFGRFCLVCLVWYIRFCRFGFVDLVPLGLNMIILIFEVLFMFEVVFIMEVD